ncbi:MAG: hypothetical protein ACRDPW_07930 [Mycobacteriales bacterium]
MATPPRPQSSDAEQVLGERDSAHRLAVSEFLGEHQGASSPFGDLKFPLSPHELAQLGGGRADGSSD